MIILSGGHLASPDAPLRYTTIPLAAGGYPFALSEADNSLTNDQWAWRFLRLSPLYRHDYELQLKRPAQLMGLGDSHIADWIDNPPPEDFQDLDSRYFCMRGKILSGKCAWPKYKKQSIAEYRQGTNEFRFKEVRVRDFDSARDFGISHWFDPSLEDLPLLGPGQSWFFNLIEPIWETGSRYVMGPAEVRARLGNGEEVVVGYEGGVRRAQPSKSSMLRNRPSPERSQLSWLEVGLDVKQAKSGDLLVRKTRPLPGGSDEVLLEVYENTEDIPLGLNPGFATMTEVVFLMDLDMYLGPQLQYVRDIADALQALHQHEGLSKKLPRAPEEFEPLMLHPARAVFQGFRHIRRAFDDLSSRSAHSSKNYRAMLFDVAYSIPSQILCAEKLLTSAQNGLQRTDPLASPRRGKDGHRAGGDHWLKRALCLLELHLNGSGSGGDVSLGAKRLVEVIYDPSDPLHVAVRAPHPLRSATSGIEARLDAIKDALKVGKDLSEYDYRYLIAMPAR